MILFSLGLIVGILVRDIKIKSIETFEQYKKNQENKGKAEFFESVTPKEKFDNAITVDDLLN